MFDFFLPRLSGELALNNIASKNRPAYARAAGWMKGMKEACELSQKKEEWISFYGQIMTEYRRFRALMEEIRAAGIEGKKTMMRR